MIYERMQMLRIIVFDELSVLKLRFEGVVDAGSVGSFRDAIETGVRDCGGRKLLADVGDLQVGDLLGETAILDAMRRGISFIAAKGRIAEILRREDETNCKRECNAFRRIAFVLTKTCSSSPRPLCLKLYRLLHRQPL
jgi:hypothetical protein